MNEPTQDTETPSLLQHILDTADDGELFGDIDETEGKAALDEHRAASREAMRVLFDAAASAWAWCKGTDDATAALPEHPEAPFTKLYAAYPELTARSLMSYRDAILRAAESADAKDRDFLYFTLGSLCSAWAALATGAAGPPPKEPLAERIRNSFSRMKTSSADDE